MLTRSPDAGRFDPWAVRGAALVRALVEVAKERGCYGMWVLTDADNDAALATYSTVGGSRRDQVMIDWEWTS